MTIKTQSGRVLIGCMKCKRMKEPEEISVELEAVQFGHKGVNKPLCFRCLYIFRLEYLHDYAKLQWRDEAEGKAA